MKNLKELRIKAGISQAELSSKMGLTQPTISNWENGKGSPDAGQRKRLKTILGDNKEAQRNSQSSPLAAWLTKARISKNWSIPELAHYSGLTAPALYRIEAGITRNLRDKTQKKLESALGSRLPEDTAEEIAQEAQIKGLGALEQFDPYVVAGATRGAWCLRFLRRQPASYLCW